MGRLTERDGRTLLTIPDSEQVFLVEQNEQLEKIKEALKGEEKVVRLAGKLSQERVEGHDGHPFVLKAEQFDVLSTDRARSRYPTTRDELPSPPRERGDG